MVGGPSNRENEKRDGISLVRGGNREVPVQSHQVPKLGRAKRPAANDSLQMPDRAPENGIEGAKRPSMRCPRSELEFGGRASGFSRSRSLAIQQTEMRAPAGEKHTKNKTRRNVFVIGVFDYYCYSPFSPDSSRRVPDSSPPPSVRMIWCPAPVSRHPRGHVWFNFACLLAPCCLGSSASGVDLAGLGVRCARTDEREEAEAGRRPTAVDFGRRRIRIPRAGRGKGGRPHTPGRGQCGAVQCNNACFAALPTTRHDTTPHLVGRLVYPLDWAARVLAPGRGTRPAFEDR